MFKFSERETLLLIINFQINIWDFKDEINKENFFHKLVWGKKYSILHNLVKISKQEKNELQINNAFIYKIKDSIMIDQIKKLLEEKNKD